MRAIAQHAVDLARAIVELHAQHRRLGQLVDDLQTTRRATGQARQRLLDVLQIFRQAFAVAARALAAIDRVGPRIERGVTRQQLFGELLLGVPPGQVQRTRAAVIDRGVVQQHLQLAAVLVPVVQVVLA